MKTIPSALCLMLAASMLPGCSTKTENPDRDQIDAVIAETAKIAARYYDSISHAPDSDMARLMTNFDNAISKINDRHAPDLYLKMNEADNDTLAKIIFRVVARRDSMLRMPQDTVQASETDSLKPEPKSL